MFSQYTHHERHVCRRPLQPLVLLSTFLVLLLVACQSPQPVPAATETQAELPAGTSEVAPQEASVEATPAVASAPELAAFVRDGILYIHNGPTEADVIPVEDCSANDCVIYYLDWSPTHNTLLYYVGGYNNSNIPHQIRVASETGTVQTVTEQAAPIQPAAWSWDGSAIVYRTDTGRFAEPSDGPAGLIQELWTVPVAADGALGEPEMRGEITFGLGCGGGGRSESATVYEREGGFAYGYLSGVIAWTQDNILLYSDNCTTRGVSRFDLANDVALEPYGGNLRSLSLDAAGDAWVAIDSENRIVTGTPNSLDITVIASTAEPEIVFYGKVTGTLYYTVLEITGGTDLIEQASSLEQEIMIFPYFDTTVAKLIALDPVTGEEIELYAGGGYAYARVAEIGGGRVIFSRVQDTAALQAAVENGVLTAENWRSYLPTVDVYAISPGSTEPSLRLIDAAQYTPAN